MENPINMTMLNDFIFCPASIYFHGLYEGVDGLVYKEIQQISGTNSHRILDEGTKYNKDVISGITVYSSKYNLIGKIDRYVISKRQLIECKKKIKEIYDGYIFQLYAQYFGMIEAGYVIDKIALYSMDDNRFYFLDLPEDKRELLQKFENLIDAIHCFSLDSFIPQSVSKCNNCIYAPMCVWSLQC